jgi:hypothetical protein
MSHWRYRLAVPKALLLLRVQLQLPFLLLAKTVLFSLFFLMIVCTEDKQQLDARRYVPLKSGAGGI